MGRHEKESTKAKNKIKVEILEDEQTKAVFPLVDF